MLRKFVTSCAPNSRKLLVFRFVHHTEVCNKFVDDSKVYFRQFMQIPLYLKFLKPETLWGAAGGSWILDPGLEESIRCFDAYLGSVGSLWLVCLRTTRASVMLKNLEGSACTFFWKFAWTPLPWTKRQEHMSGKRNSCRSTRSAQDFKKGKIRGRTILLIFQENLLDQGGQKILKNALQPVPVRRFNFQVCTKDSPI